jgi:hypothetical protein
MEVYMRTVDSQKDFLKDDLSDALKGLFVGAVVWEAADRAEKAKEKERCPFLKRLAATESFVQARALYEFYTPTKDKPKGERGEPAYASHFGQWTEKEFGVDVSGLFEKYMEDGRSRACSARILQPISAFSISRMIGATFREGQDIMARIISRISRSNSRGIFVTSLKSSSRRSRIVFVTARRLR